MRTVAGQAIWPMFLLCFACGGSGKNGSTSTEPAGGGAGGAEQGCPDGQEVGSDGQCRPIAASCELLACDKQGRLCAEKPSPACTHCDSDRGYIDAGDGSCVLAAGACSSQSDCKDGEYCQKLDTDPTRPASCSPAQACTLLDAKKGQQGMSWDSEKQACVACSSCLGVEGATGKLWPVTAGGGCVCETKDGYYFDAAVSTRAPRACDADGDGWVENPARDAISSSDVAISSNAHCHVRSVSGFTLQNERGETRQVKLSEVGLGTDSLELFEPRALDSQEELGAASERTPAYGKLRFAPNQLNPLTKACVSPHGDYNQDGLFDIEQTQSQVPSGDDEWLAPFVGLAYFVELYSGYFAPGKKADQPGRYVITEKSRCDAAQLPLDYGSSSLSDYWQRCERRRASDYSDAAPGSDFGRFTCKAAAGSCPAADPTQLFDAAEADPLTLIPLHQSCGGMPGPTFTGMNHASQFRCAQFQDTVSTPYGVDLKDVYESAETGSSYVANVCAIAKGDKPIDGSDDAVEAPLSCVMTPRSELSTGQVGWALAQFSQYTDSAEYTRGCIGEGAEWPALCPGQGSVGSRALSNAFDFGNLYCGCGREFGGSDCEIACAPGTSEDTQVHLGGTPDAAWSDNDQALFSCDANGYCSNVICQPGDASCKPGRHGYWMCSTLAATTGVTAPSTAGTWSLTSASIPYSAVDRSKLLCDPQSADCSSGYSLH